MPRDRRRATRVMGWVVAAVAALVALGVGGWLFLRPGSAAAGASPTPQVTTATAARTTQRQTVTTTGTIQPRVQANLNFPVGGTVTQVQARVGTPVHRGDLLAQVDRTSLQSSLALAQANVDAAAANADQVRANAAATQAQLASADAQLASAQAKRDAAQQSLAQADLTCPIDGTVALVNVAVGDKVTGASSTSGGGSSGSGNAGGAGGSGSGSGSGGSSSGGQGSGGSSGSGSTSASTAQVVVIATDAWQVNASVTSADLGSIKPGLQAEMTQPGSADKVFGTVASVGVVATSSGGSAAFPVVVNVTGTPKNLYAGAPADVTLVVRQFTDVLTVPTAAISTQDGHPVVQKVVAGRATATPVGVGQVFGQQTEITSGLQEGDEVQVVGRTFARPSGGATPGSGRTRGSGQGGSGQNGAGQGGSGQNGSGQNGGRGGGSTGGGAPGGAPGGAAPGGN